MHARKAHLRHATRLVRLEGGAPRTYLADERLPFAKRPSPHERPQHGVGKGEHELLFRFAEPPLESLGVKVFRTYTPMP